MNAKETPPQKSGINIRKSDINIGNIEGLVNVSDVHFNVSQEVIITTEDKIRLSLSKQLKKMEKKRSWITPLSMLISFTLILITAGFKDAGLDAATWRAIFIIADVASFVWLIYSIKDALSSVKIEDVIDGLKKDYKTKKNP